jgi:hypothetical protein
MDQQQHQVQQLVQQAQAQADSAEQSFTHMDHTLGLLSDEAPASKQEQQYADHHKIRLARGKKTEWRATLGEMREQCRRRGLDNCPELTRQLEGQNMMAQKESLVRFLHVARADGLILVLDNKATTTVNCSSSSDINNNNNNNRWAGFRVTHSDFFARLVGLFGLDMSDIRVNSQSWRTINTGWTRLGFAPNGPRGKHDIWTRAYSGQLDFVSV